VVRENRRTGGQNPAWEDFTNPLYSAARFAKQAVRHVEESVVKFECVSFSQVSWSVPPSVGSSMTRAVLSSCLLFVLICTGCGTTKSQLATQQLLTSDAIDRTVAQIDFSVLSGQSVYFDPQYIDGFKPIGFITNKYIISALRQQMFAAKCIVMETRDEADYIIEARVGALGTDEHDVTYGLPASSMLSTAAAIVSSSPVIPTIPEVSIARRQEQMGATKINVFAYHRESKTPVWQSGNNTATSYAKSFWIFGAGPFQRGSVYDGTRFAGARLATPFSRKSRIGVPIVSLDQEHIFFENAPSSPVDEARVAEARVDDNTEPSETENEPTSNE